MADSFTQSSHQSWGSRIVSSLTGVVIGIVLILASVFLLSWNEHRAITTARSLAEGAKIVIDVQAGSVDPANSGKLVHVTGDVTTSAGVSDTMFEISTPALRLKRKVEMFQWKQNESSEEKKNLGGSTETVTTYTYEKVWSDSLIDSSSFKQPEGHANPSSMLAGSETFVTPDAKLGAFTVPERLLTQMSGDVALVPTPQDFEKLPEALRANAQLTSSGYYFGNDPKSAAIGDQRVTFAILKPGVFSIIAQQNGSTFQPYPASAGAPIERVESGAVDAKLMFQHAQDENTLLTWLVRLGGLVMMWIGLAMILKPLSVLADVIPFLGGIVGAAGGLVSLLIALVGTFVTIAVAWLAVRPLLGGTLLVVAGAVLAIAVRAAFRRKKAS